jgi:hypothetical protein
VNRSWPEKLQQKWKYRDNRLGEAPLVQNTYMATVLKYGYKTQNKHSAASRTAINQMGGNIKKLRNVTCIKMRLIKLISGL